MTTLEAEMVIKPEEQTVEEATQEETGEQLSPPRAEINVEFATDVLSKHEQLVKETFTGVAEKFGLSTDLLAELVGERIEMSPNDQGQEAMLAAFVWDSEKGKKLRLFENAFKDEEGNEITDEAELKGRIGYLIGHELSHAIVHTGAVVDLEGLHNSLVSGASDKGIADHLRKYISNQGIVGLERHFTVSQAQKYLASGKSPSEQWSFAQEVIAERFHEYESAKGDKNSFIAERLKGLQLDSFIMENYPNQFESPKDVGEKAFWQKVGETFSISVAENSGPIEVYEALTQDGGPLEFLKEDIDFWFDTFQKSLGETPEKKIRECLEAQNEEEIDSSRVIDVTMGDSQTGRYWFGGEEQTMGRMPSNSNSLGERGMAGVSVPEKLFQIGNWLAGLSSAPGNLPSQPGQ